MIYEEPIYRPPSEAHSLLIQVTIGCSHNRCTFCANNAGKQFRVRAMEEIMADLDECAELYGNRVQRVFLCDSNALAMPMGMLREILGAAREKFPRCERVGVYATALDLLRKTPEELAELRGLGLKIVYVGLESGSDKVLRAVRKGITSEQMIAGAQAARQAGITLSVMVITGLGGPELSMEHARESARVLNAMQPDYLGLLALMVMEGTELYRQVQAGEFTLLTPREVTREMLELVGGLELENCFFSSVHASNYISLRGRLPQDKARLLSELRYYLDNEAQYKDEYFRLL